MNGGGGMVGREVYWCLVFEVVRVVDAEVCKEVIDFGDRGRLYFMRVGSLFEGLKGVVKCSKDCRR